MRQKTNVKLQLEKILLVDDDPEFRSELHDYLEEYQVLEAPNGQEALQLLKMPHDIDLVLLDVMMPGLCGTEVLKEIKKIAPDVSIIILTGHSSKDIAIESLRGHANDYIEKPFDIIKTKKIIEKVLDNKKDKKSNELFGNDEFINKITRFVQRNCHKKLSLNDVAKEICLSPKYVSRLFKEHMGIGLTEYRLSMKIERSKILLNESSYNIDQIAEKIGYENTESFIRQFKKFTKYTPTAYRKKTKHPKRNKTAARKPHAKTMIKNPKQKRHSYRYMR